MNIADEIRNMFLPITERWARFELMHSDPLRRLNRELREFGFTARQVGLFASLFFYIISHAGLHLEGIVLGNYFAAVLCIVPVFLSKLVALVFLLGVVAEVLIPQPSLREGEGDKPDAQKVENRRGWLAFAYGSALVALVSWAGFGLVLAFASGYTFLCFWSFKEPDFDGRPNLIRIAFGLED